MWEKYQETFDGVHASQRLKTEVLNMKRDENVTKRHKIPAVLVAAALLVVLAGTALAVDHFANGKVRVEPMEGSYKNGYSVQGDMGMIALESLSDEVLDLAAQPGRKYDILPFGSFSEAEAFLGLEIVNNARLDRMEFADNGMRVDDDPWVDGNCLLHLKYEERTLGTIQLIANYCEDEITVYTQTVLRPMSPESDKWSFARGNRCYQQSGTEDYVTPSGLETTIVTSKNVNEAGEGYYAYEGYFIRNNVYFYVKSEVTESRLADSALALLKEILDAYE